MPTAIPLAFLAWLFGAVLAGAQGDHGAQGRDALDRMRDRDLQPERVMDVIGLRPGMVVGEAGASYGYFTFKMSARVGPTGRVYANDIAAAALDTLRARADSQRVRNVETVLGEEADPLFPIRELDMIVVFDCLFEFSRPAAWMANARKYLKPGGRLVIVDPDRSKMSSVHFLSRPQIQALAREAGYTIVPVDDAFLKSHMIVVLRPARPGDGGAAPARRSASHRRASAPGARAPTVRLYSRSDRSTADRFTAD